MTDSRALVVETLTATAFAPFGDVIAPDAAQTRFAINGGTTQRLHALGRVTHDGGDVVISLGLAQARQYPFAIEMLERHPLGSQAFIPLDGRPYLIVVAEDPSSRPRAFLAAQGEGVNFRAGTWHHPLLALADDSRFLIVDRDGTEPNCDERQLAESWSIAPGIG